MKKKQIFILSIVGAAIASVAAYIIVKRNKKGDVENDAHDGLAQFAGKKGSKHLTPVFSKAKSYLGS